MKLAISNFVWDYNKSKDTFDFLKTVGIKNIEVVLTKYKPWSELSEIDILKYKDELNDWSVDPFSMQSLFFNINCTINDVDIVINHFKRIIDYSEILGTKILVFGSPSLRKKITGYEINLSKVFKAVDVYLENKNINVVIEPNTSLYGGEYFINVSEIVNFIKINDLQNIKTMIDTHNIILENGDPIIDIEEFFDYIYHVHISEPGLSCIKEKSFHIDFSNKLKEVGYNKIVTYEVNKCDNINESIKLFSEIYK